MHRSEHLRKLLGPAGRNAPADQNAAAAADEITAEAGERTDETCRPAEATEVMTLEQAKQIFEEAEKTERRRCARAEEILDTQATAEALDEHLAALRRRGLRHGR